jgi:hypothetical protein
VEAVGKFSSGPGRVVGEIAQDKVDFPIIKGYIRWFLDQISLIMKLIGWDSHFAQGRLWNAQMVKNCCPNYGSRDYWDHFD